MLPDGELSSHAHISGFTFPVKQPGDFREDWELAGVALNDTSQGLRVKLWHLEAKYNEDTGQMDAIVSAPGVAPTVLFSAADIREVALAFDQNMNPCVAYLEGSTPKLYWHDPTIPAMKHTTMPSGVKDMRLTLDEKRGNPLTGDSDIVLAYISSQNLCVRYQRERYGTEHVLRSGIGAGASLVSMAMNDGYRLQFRLRGYTLNDPSAQVVGVPYLGDIVLDLCKQAGIDPKNVDVSDLFRESDIVEGLMVDTDTGLDKPIDWLSEIYLFDKSQYDKKLRFFHRGRDVVMRIPYSDLVTNGNKEVLQQKKMDGKDLPTQVDINYLDSTVGFSKNKQTANRRSNLIVSDAKLKIDSRVIMTPDTAASAALSILKARWGEQREYKFSTTLRYTQLVAADVVEVEDSRGDWHRVRITERNEDGCVIDWEAIQDAGITVYGATHDTGITLPPSIPTTPGEIGTTHVTILDIPVQRDQDDELGYYVAIRGDGSGWNGGVVQLSLDGGATVFDTIEAPIASSVGVVMVGMIEDISSEYYDNQTLTVSINSQLESITREALYQYQNRLAVQLDSGAWEVLQFQTATLVAESTYTLSGIVRGRYATGTGVVETGATVAVIGSNTPFYQMQTALNGATISYRGVSYGQDPDEVSWQTMTVTNPMSQMEWPVANVQAERNGSNDVTVTWIERPRLGAETAPRHSKYFTVYRVKYSDGATFDVTGTTHIRTSAPANQTITVVGLNSITGEGIESEAVTV